MFGLKTRGSGTTPSCSSASGVFVFSAIFQPLVASKAEKTLLDAVDSGADTGPALRPSHRVFAIDVAVVLVALWAMVVRLGA